MKKIITLLLTLSVILTLSACGNSQSKKDDKTITIACSPTPHAQILAQAKEILKEIIILRKIIPIIFIKKIIIKIKI